MTASTGSDLGHRSLSRGVAGIACAVSLVLSAGWGKASLAQGMDCSTLRRWCGGASVVLIKFTVCGQTRGSGAACTAVTILGRRCVPYWEQNQASGLTVCVLNYILGLSLHLSQTSAISQVMKALSR